MADYPSDGGVSIQYITEQLAFYLRKNELPGILSDYVQTVTFNATIQDLENTLSGIGDTLNDHTNRLDTQQAEIDGLKGGTQSGGEPVDLTDYRRIDDSHSKTEIDTALGLKVNANTYTAAIQGLNEAIGTKADASALSDAVNTLNAELGKKVDESTYNAKVAEFAAQIAALQEADNNLQDALNSQSGVVRRHLDASATLNDAEHAFLNSSGGSFTLTVKADSSYQLIRDLGGYLKTNPVTVDLPNGDQILMNTNGIELELFKINGVWEAHPK